MANDSNFDRNRVKGCSFGSEGAVLDLRGGIDFPFRRRIFPLCYTSLNLKLRQIALSCLHAEMGLQLVHLVVSDGIDQWQMGDLHVNLCRLFGGLDEAERLVQVFSRAVDAMLRPDNKPGGAHLLSGGLTDLVRAAEHPRQHIHAVRKDDDDLGSHLPQGAGEGFFI